MVFDVCADANVHKQTSIMDEKSKSDAGVTGTDKNPFAREFGVSFSSKKEEVSALLKKQLDGKSYVQLNE